MSANFAWQGRYYLLGVSMRVYACFIAAGGPVAGAVAGTLITIYPPADGAAVLGPIVMSAEVGGVGAGQGWYYRTFTPNSGPGLYKYEADIIGSSVWVSGMFYVTDQGVAI